MTGETRTISLPHLRGHAKRRAWMRSAVRDDDRFHHLSILQTHLSYVAHVRGKEESQTPSINEKSRARSMLTKPVLSRFGSFWFHRAPGLFESFLISILSKGN